MKGSTCLPRRVWAADGGGAALVSAYLFTLLAASMLLLQKLEVELFLLLLVELLELLLQKGRRCYVSAPLSHARRGLKDLEETSPAAT